MAAILAHSLPNNSVYLQPYVLLELEIEGNPAIMAVGSNQSLKPKIIKIYVGNRHCYGIIIIPWNLSSIPKRVRAIRRNTG